MPVKSTRNMTKSPDPLKVEKVDSGSLLHILFKYWSQISDNLAGTDSPQEDEGNIKEEESGSGDVDSTYANQAAPDGSDGEARNFWDKLPADTKRDLAREEFVNLETNKQFQMYLKALILEAKNMYQKNYLEFM